MNESKQRRSDGQAVLEYILLLAIVVSLFGFVLNLLSGTNMMTNLKKPLEQTFIVMGIQMPGVKKMADRNTFLNIMISTKTSEFS